MHSALVIAEKFCRLANEKAKKDCVASSLCLNKLMKILYLAHGYKLATRGKPLFGDVVECWEYGPVVPSVYHHVNRVYGKKCSTYPIPNIPDVTDEDMESMLLEDLEIIEEVFESHYRYTAYQLINYTHEKGSPWHKVYYSGSRDIVIYDDDTMVYYEKKLKLKD